MISLLLYKLSVRGLQARAVYQYQKEAIVKVQAHGRKMIAQNQVAQIRIQRDKADALRHNSAALIQRKFLDYSHNEVVAVLHAVVVAASSNAAASQIQQIYRTILQARSIYAVAQALKKSRHEVIFFYICIYKYQLLDI